MKPDKRAICLATVVLALAGLPSMAAETSVWQGGDSGVWGAGYTGNWDTYPDSTRYTQFGAPYNDPITVTVNESVDAYGIESATGRAAGLNFTGSGTINNYRATLFANNSAPSLTDWNIDVVNQTSGMYNSYIEGTNIFHKSWNCTASDYINTKARAKVTLCDSAAMMAQHVKIVSGSSFECLDSSVSTFSKDLRIEPGASFRIADNAVVNLRGLFLPFSREEGVSDEWVMEGGLIRGSNPNPTNSNYRVDMAYTNATKTLSGTGTFYLSRFDCANASNLIFRLNGPDMYVCNGYISSSAIGYKRVRFEIGGGSTLGLHGGDYTFDRWTNRVVGAATVDTTDYTDKTTPRTIALSNLLDCNGILTVKGVGTCKLTGAEQPNLGFVGTDSSTISLGSAYALADIVLHDSSKMKVTEYLGHKTQESYRNVKSLTMDGNSTLDVGRYVIFSGDATLSGNARAVIRHTGSSDANPMFTCANLSLSDSASLSVTGTIAATSLTMSGNAHLSFTAGTAFSAGAAFGAGNWTMEITIPSGYEAGIRPVVLGAGFEGDFADHVTLIGDTEGWSARTLDGSLILYKDAPPSGIEWIGKSASSDNWSDTANWNGGNIPTAGDIVAFGGLDRRTPYNDSVGTVSGLVFRASAGPFVLSGSGALTTTAESISRGDSNAGNAAIVSHSAFDQIINPYVDFGDHNVLVLSDGGAAIKLMGGVYAANNWKYLIIGGDVMCGGTCSVGIVSFKTSTTAVPSRLTVLPGCVFTIRNHYFRGFSEYSGYAGRLVVQEGGEMIVKDGDCSFLYGGFENVIDGTLRVKSDQDSGRLVAGQTEQYYVGSGKIYADSARSARDGTTTLRYINFGGSLKLYMNGPWYTATYRTESEHVRQDPNLPSRFRMTDGTTLGATKDWYYGPREGAYDTIANTITPADRASIMVGTVTVDTQNPDDETKSHTITFYDPLDASAANVVKAGAGSLVFNSTNNCPSQISNLTVNAGSVLFTGDVGPTVGSACVNVGGTLRVDAASELGDLAIAGGATASFAAAPTLSGTLTIASKESSFRVDGLAGKMEWDLLATAADIVGPDNAVNWHSNAGSYKLKIVTDGTVKKLYGGKVSGFSVVVR